MRISESLLRYPWVENELPKNGVFSEVDNSEAVAWKNPKKKLRIANGEIFLDLKF